MAIQVNLRVGEELRNALVASAERRGVSMNKEINDRLAGSLDADALGERDAALDGLLAIVAAAMSSAGWAAASFSTLTPEGARQWLDNPVAYEQAVRAAAQVLQAAAPPSANSPPISEQVASAIEGLGAGFANAMLEEAANGTSRIMPDGIARARVLRAGISDELAARLKAGEPREPVILQAAPYAVTKLTRPTPSSKAKQR